jgi:hypothetical protein
MSNIFLDPAAFKASCTVLFDNPNTNTGYNGPVGLCSICSALILMDDAALGSHFRWHYIHWEIHSMFSIHNHSPINGVVNSLPDPDTLALFNAFG